MPPSLALLLEIQRTGDIFFPKRWMDATLSGQRSVAASRMVSGFVASLPPDYPDRLRRVILSSAGDLSASRAHGDTAPRRIGSSLEPGRSRSYAAFFRARLRCTNKNANTANRMVATANPMCLASCEPSGNGDARLAGRRATRAAATT